MTDCQLPTINYLVSKLGFLMACYPLSPVWRSSQFDSSSKSKLMISSIEQSSIAPSQFWTTLRLTGCGLW
ncbi:MAG: hypothetical protein HC786_04735 [Richelia sp. CSU_2_1]|nr:hypothetical protein [Richelia sp. CSU_2_1]